MKIIIFFQGSLSHIILIILLAITHQEFRWRSNYWSMLSHMGFQLQPICKSEFFHISYILVLVPLYNQCGILTLPLEIMALTSPSQTESQFRTNNKPFLGHPTWVSKRGSDIILSMQNSCRLRTVQNSGIIRSIQNMKFVQNSIYTMQA